MMLRTVKSASVLCGFCLALGTYTATAEPFDFVALGDTAYNLPEDYETYEALIDTINQAEPAFSVHVGDIWGVAQCTDELYERHLGFFNSFTHPLIYTPGDNEWVDCHFTDPAMRDPDTGLFRQREFIDGMGEGISVDRLQSLRRIFFSKPESLGAKRMAVERQADGGDFPDMVENFRWSRDGALFATFHIPGSMSGLSITSPAANVEAVRRHQANYAWLEETFDEAQNKGSKAIVLITHADMFLMASAPDAGPFAVSEYRIRGDALGPYFWFSARIATLAARYEGQVLLVHGDGHRFIIDRPLTIYRGEEEQPSRPHITRLQVYGAPEIKAVRVTVDTEKPWVFSFSPLYN